MKELEDIVGIELFRRRFLASWLGRRKHRFWCLFDGIYDIVFYRVLFFDVIALRIFQLDWVVPHRIRRHHGIVVRSA